MRFLFLLIECVVVRHAGDSTVQCTWSAVMYCKDCIVFLCPVTVISFHLVIVRDSPVIMVIVGNSP